MKITLVRQPWGFAYATDEDAGKARKIRQGTVVTAEVKVLRNPKLHRKFFAMLNTAWNFLTEAQQEFFHGSVEGFRATVTIAAGYYDTVYSVARREWQQVPKSISFGRMSEAEFGKLYDDAVNLIFRLFLDNNRVGREQFNEAMKDF